MEENKMHSIAKGQKLQEEMLQRLYLAQYRKKILLQQAGNCKYCKRHVRNFS